MPMNETHREAINECLERAVEIFSSTPHGVYFLTALLDPSAQSNNLVQILNQVPPLPMDIRNLLIGVRELVLGNKLRIVKNGEHIISLQQLDRRPHNLSNVGEITSEEIIAFSRPQLEQALQQLTPGFLEMTGKFFNGVGRGSWNFVKRSIYPIIHPIQTARNLIEAISHPITFCKTLWRSLSNYASEDPVAFGTEVAINLLFIIGTIAYFSIPSASTSVGSVSVAKSVSTIKAASVPLRIAQPIPLTVASTSSAFRVLPAVGTVAVTTLTTRKAISLLSSHQKGMETKECGDALAIFSEDSLDKSLKSKKFTINLFDTPEINYIDGSKPKFQINLFESVEFVETDTSSEPLPNLQTERVESLTLIKELGELTISGDLKLKDTTKQDTNITIVQKEVKHSYFFPIRQEDRKAIAQIIETHDFLSSEIGLSISASKRQSYLAKLAFYEKLAKHARLNVKDRQALNELLENIQVDRAIQLSLNSTLSFTT